MRILSKIVAMVIVLAMLFSLPLSAFAEEDNGIPEDTPVENENPDVSDGVPDDAGDDSADDVSEDVIEDTADADAEEPESSRPGKRVPSRLKSFLAPMDAAERLEFFNSVYGYGDLTGTPGESLPSGLMRTMDTDSGMKTAVQNDVTWWYTELGGSACRVEGSDAVKATSLVIPDTIGGLTVTQIGDGAFRSYSRLESVQLPATVTSIGEQAFALCVNLETITLPNTLTQIGGLAFSYCMELQSITIPQSVTDVGGGAFAGCGSLEAFIEGGSNESFSFEDGILFDKDKDTLVCYPAGKNDGGNAVELPGSVTALGDYAFAGVMLSNGVNLPDNLESIGDFAFFECYGLETVSLPSEVDSVGEGAFDSCFSLESIEVDTSNTAYSSGDGVLYKGTQLIRVPSNWYNGSVFVVPQGVTTIAKGAFAECFNITGVTLPATGLTAIGDEAFRFCWEIKSITIPASVTTIGTDVFSYCILLESITVASANGAYASENGVLYNKNKSQLICCPAGKKGSLSLNANTTSIAPRAFYACFSLTAVTLPSGLVTIGEGAFQWCDRITAITVPASVTTIGDQAFGYCMALRDINVSASNTAYASDGGCLYNKTKTTLICVPSGKTGSFVPANTTVQIADYAAAFCAEINSVSLPSSVTGIGRMAFAWCDSLTTINFAGAVTSVGDEAAAYCPRLAYVGFWGNAPAQFGRHVFDSSGSKFRIYYKSGTSGWSTPKWKGYACRVIPGSLSKTNLKSAVSAGYNGATITWDAVDDASHYELYRAESSSGTYVLVTATNATSRTDSNLIAGKTYYYKVRAYLALGSSKIYGAYSDVKSVKTTVAAPSSLTAASASYSSIKLSWSAVSGANGFEVYRATSSSGTYSRVTTVTSGSTRTYTNTGLTAGVTYYYRVRAYRTVGSSKVFGGYSPIRSAVPVLSAPSGLKATASGYNSIKLSWSKVSGASGYEIYRATSANGTYTRIKTQSGTSLTNSSLSTGTTYHYKVRAYRTVSGKKGYGNYSAVQSARPTLSKTGSVKTRTSGYNTAKISWSSVKGASGYEIFRATSSGGTYTRVGITGSRSYTDKTLQPYTTYYYRVRAYRNVSGGRAYGAYSDIKTAKTVMAKPGSVKSSSAAPLGIKLSWKSVPGATSYQVYRSTSKSGSYTLAGTATTTNYTDKGLAAGKTYYYKIRPCRTAGGKTVYGPYSSIRTAKAPTAVPGSLSLSKAPISTGGTTPADAQPGIRLKWKAVKGATGYEVWRSTTKSGTYTRVSTTRSAGYTDAGLEAGKTYYYKVRMYVTYGSNTRLGNFTSVKSARVK